MEDSSIRVHRDPVHRDQDSCSHDPYPAHDSRSADTGPATDTTPTRPAWPPHRSIASGHDTDAAPDIRIDRTDAFVIRQACITPPTDEEVAASTHASGLLDDCVAEFTRRLQACMTLTDDEHFHARVLADIQALKARCRPEDAFRFQLKAARVLAEFGFTAWPSTSDTLHAPPPPHDVAPVVDAPETGEAAPRPDPRTGARAA